LPRSIAAGNPRILQEYAGLAGVQRGLAAFRPRQRRNRMIRILCALSAVALGATMVLAQNLAPIKERQNAMKKISDDAKVLNAMAKGEAPFDAAKATALLAGWEETAKKLPNLFPDDSKTGEKTRAKAEIWQNKADFNAKIADFAKAVSEAKAKAPSADSFKAAFPAIGKACGNCHEKYRGPRVT
jgi:cytochrome c556